MKEDILCCECGHSLAFHGWYGGCECPVEGKFHKCKCTQTHYSHYVMLHKQLEVAREALENIVSSHDGYCEHHINVSRHSDDLDTIARLALLEIEKIK